MNSRHLTKIALRLFIVSVCAAALVGIWAIAIPSENWDFRFKVFLTTAIIAAASVCGLACGGCFSRGHRILPGAGLGLAIISAVLLLVGMWSEIPSESYWKVTVSLSFFAVACAHLSMLFMANLAGSYRWAYLIAYQLILGLAALLSAGAVFEYFDEEGFWRLTGVISILVAAVTLLIPIFHRFSRDAVIAAAANADPLFAVEEEIARLKKRLLELEHKRRVLLERPAAMEESAH
jgi:hypothetical protein